jgi:competence protein ComEC
MQIALPKKQKIIAVVIGLSILIAFFVFSIVSQGNNLEVVFFDVGQGSSIFIETPRKNQVLIDGGPNNLLILEQLSKEIPFWDRHINIVISTHSSADHLTGLIEVLKRYNIDKIIWTGMNDDSLTHQQFIEELRVAEKRGTEIIIAQFSKKIYLEPEIYLKILNPLVNLEGKDPENHNNNSIVTRLIFRETSFLFTSDIEKERELLLVQKQRYLEQDFLSADILKIPHHGSKTSSNLKFLETVNPKKAVIQVGKNNRFDHPHQEVINRLNKKEVNIFRTDINGTIKIISNGNKYEILTKK